MADEPKTHFDENTGKQYVILDRPKYNIWDEIIFKTHFSYQSPVMIKMGENELFKNQVMTGTILWAMLNLDTGKNWKYLIKHNMMGDKPDYIMEDAILMVLTK